MEQSNLKPNLRVRKIEGAYGLQLDQPEVTLIKIGDTAMIAKAFDVTASTPEELIEAVASSFGIEKTCMKILTIAEVEQIRKSMGESSKRIRVF